MIKDEHRRTKRREVRAKVREYLLTHPCVDCGETDPVVLEFDHRERGTKSGPVATMIVHGRLWPSVKAEIDKCDVRCANCHRRRTAKQMGWYARGKKRKAA